MSPEIKRKFLLALFLPAIVLCVFAFKPGTRERDSLKVMFYNTENFFDTLDDPHTSDNEFLPEGTYRWKSFRYYSKLNHLFQTIAATGENHPPDVIGLVEVENETVLKDLIWKTPLEKYPYKIIHRNSPDPRGIDVALLYRSDRIHRLTEKFYPLLDDSGNVLRTREILYFKGIYDTDTLHFFVNHWPSRRGGQKKSEPKRMLASKKLKFLTDSILSRNPLSLILVMGDFNDEPQNTSLQYLTKSARPDFSSLSVLIDDDPQKCQCGSLKYQSAWNIFDLFLASNALTNGASIRIFPDDVKIVRLPFLIVDDEKYGGEKPFRTYIGPRYQGGYSDHLPIVLEIKSVK